MFGFFLAGNIIIFLSGIIFAVLLISIIISFLTSYLCCIITLYVMAYISPIFIPMLLFERTKVYFDSWLKIIISCLIQPAVLAGFAALLLTMYDSAIFKNCEFLHPTGKNMGCKSLNYTKIWFSLETKCYQFFHNLTYKYSPSRIKGKFWAQIKLRSARRDGSNIGFLLTSQNTTIEGDF